MEYGDRLTGDDILITGVENSPERNVQANSARKVQLIEQIDSLFVMASQLNHYVWKLPAAGDDFGKLEYLESTVVVRNTDVFIPETTSVFDEGIDMNIGDVSKEMKPDKQHSWSIADTRAHSRGDTVAACERNHRRTWSMESSLVIIS